MLDDAVRAGVDPVHPVGAGRRQTLRAPVAMANALFGTPWEEPSWIVATTRFDDRGALFTMGSNGHGLTRITPWTVGGASPDWSPNGREIVFDSYSNEGLRAGISRNLYSVRPFGRNRPHSDHTRRRGLRTGLQASWSPNGEWIAFTREVNAQQTPGSHGAQGTYIMRGDGTDIRRIAAEGRGGHSVSWGR